MRLESQYSFNHYQTVADCRGPTRNALYASAAVSELDSRGPPGAAASSHDAARPGVTCPGQYGHDRSVTSLRVSAGPGPSLGFGSGWPGMTEPEGPAQPGPGASESKPALERRHAPDSESDCQCQWARQPEARSTGRHRVDHPRSS